MRYRKKPVVIEAFQWDGVTKWDTSWPVWFIDALNKPKMAQGSAWIAGKTVEIVTLEGNHTAMPGDWIIQGIQGELYPCKPDIFKETYDKED